LKERKNIDRLFQERFKDFEAHPSPEVWAKIKDRLDQKRKRRVIPLWWKLGGAAALLALLFFVGNLYFAPSSNFPQKNDPQFVTTDSTEKRQEGHIALPNSNKDSVNGALVANRDQETEKDSENRSKSGENTTKSTISSSEAALATDSNSASGESKSAENSIQYKASKEEALAETSTGKTDEKGSKSGENTTKSTVSSSGAVSTTDSNFAYGERRSAENPINNKTSKEALTETSTEKSAENDQKTANNPENQAVIAQNKNMEQQGVSQINEKSVVTNQPRTEKAEELSEEKSLAQIVQEEQAANVDDEAIENEKNAARRWALTPNIAPVYYDSFGGSGIAPQFDGNSKEGRVNLSYGLLVSYAINDKLTVRSGLSKIDLSYNTNDAILFTGAQTGTLQSVNFNGQADVIQVESAVRASSSDAPVSNAVEISDINSSEGYVNQRLAYFEVPMEVEYALVENRVGVQLIGGLSTLFLNDSALTFSDNDFKTSLPESANLNDVSFSTNVGLGLDYKFTDDIKFNLQPMFKYQLNAYKNNVSDFKPYYLGLYTGFSIKF